MSWFREGRLIVFELMTEEAAINFWEVGLVLAETEAIELTSSLHPCEPSSNIAQVRTSQLLVLSRSLSDRITSLSSPISWL